MSVIFVSDDVTDQTKDMINSMKISGISVHQIMPEDEISNILSRAVIDLI
jgi:hypothetical protein